MLHTILVFTFSNFAGLVPFTVQYMLTLLLISHFDAHICTVTFLHIVQVLEASLLIAGMDPEDLSKLSTSAVNGLSPSSMSVMDPEAFSVRLVYYLTYMPTSNLKNKKYTIIFPFPHYMKYSNSVMLGATSKHSSTY